MSELHDIAAALPRSMKDDVLRRLDELIDALLVDDDEPKAINTDSWRHAVDFLAGCGIVMRPGISVTYDGNVYLQWNGGDRRLAGMTIKPDGKVVWATTNPSASGYGHVSDFDLGEVAAWAFEL